MIGMKAVGSSEPDCGGELIVAANGTGDMALYLEPLNGGRQIVLDKAVILIGRQSDCDIVLDNSRKVSRKHCAIAQVNDTYIVRDLESMNGVSVNGNRVKREAPLQVGDEIAFGDVRYVLRETAAMNGRDGTSEKPVVVPAAVSPPVPPKPVVPSRPVNLSQKFPVPIDEEGVEFAVEPSMQFEQSPVLSPDDLLEPIIELQPDAERSAPPKPRDADADDDQIPDVILLDESGEADNIGQKS